jgi:hypothetical protein
MQRTNILDAIKIGMPVLQESDKEKIGKVEFVRYGEGLDSVDLPEVDTLVEILADAFSASNKYPDAVYKKLYAEGFIKVERGLKSDVFVFPNQIAHVVNGEVHINVNEDDLMKE